MARKIKFPLEMNGTEIRSLEELKENFSAAQVLKYLENGKLITWLRDRGLHGMAEQVQELKIEDLNSLIRLCEILDLPTEKAKEYIKNEAVRRERIHRLKRITDKVEENLINQVAFNQNELYERLEEGQKEIYLCGDRFLIPLTKNGITYIGINNPVVVIDSKEEVNWIKLDISLKNVVYDQKYQNILEEKRKREQISKTMICMEDKILYKFDEDSNRFVVFYRFRDLDMYYRNVAQDAKNVYFMQEKGKFTGIYEIVSINLQNGQKTELFDLTYKEPLNILCIRNGKLFLRGQFPKTNKIIRIDIKTRENKIYLVDDHTTSILIDEEGENAYLRIQNGPRKDQEICRYSFKDQKNSNIAYAYNIHGMDLVKDYLMFWGKDTKKPSSKEYYYYTYNTKTEKIEKQEGDKSISTHALWRNEKIEYRMTIIGIDTLNEKYQLFEKDLITQSKRMLCVINREQDRAFWLDGKIRLWKGYFYLYYRIYSEDSLSGNGKGIGYEVNSIPRYRIRLSDSCVQKFNGTAYENVSEWR